MRNLFLIHTPVLRTSLSGDFLYIVSYGFESNHGSVSGPWENFTTASEGKKKEGDLSRAESGLYYEIVQSQSTGTINIEWIRAFSQITSYFGVL